MSYDPNNIFARILRKEISCTPVFEDDQVLAFYDINPKASTHILVIPKGEYVDFYDFSTRAPSDTISHFYRIAAQIAEQYGLTQTGFRVVANVGMNGGQEVPHFHIHLLGSKTKLGPIC